jgi:hypothetical protein
MREAGQRGKGIVSKRGISIFVAAIIALSVALTSPVGAAGLRSWDRQSRETSFALNMTPRDAFQDFMGIQDLAQVDFFLGMPQKSARWMIG